MESKEVCRDVEPLLGSGFSLGFGAQTQPKDECRANADHVDVRQLFSTFMKQLMLQKEYNPT